MRWVGRLLIAALLGALLWFQFGQPRTGQQLYQHVADMFDRRPARTILILGNSRTFYHDMPSMIRDMADSAHSPTKYEIEVQALEGASFESLWGDSRTQDLLGQRWDDVILQGESRGQATDVLKQSFLTYGMKLIDAVHPTSGAPRLVVNWDYGPELFDGGDPDGTGRAAYFAAVQAGTKLLGERTGAHLVNVGRLWAYVRTDHPETGLTEDGNHPSLAGSYLFALMLYSDLSHQDAGDVTYVPPGLDVAAAMTLRQAVHDEETFETRVERHGKTQHERRYYLSSAKLDAEAFAQAVRAHWGIENRLHWVLDVVFHDDLVRLRTDNGPHNMALVRHIAMNLVRNPKDKHSLKVRRKLANLNPDYLETLIRQTPALTRSDSPGRRARPPHPERSRTSGGIRRSAAARNGPAQWLNGRRTPRAERNLDPDFESPEQESDIVLGEVCRRGGILAPQCFGQGCLTLLQSQDLLLDRAGREHPVNEHRLLLADTVSAVDRLRLDSWIPPGIVENDGVSAREVEARAACLEAHQNERHLTGLEPRNRLLAILGLAGEFSPAMTMMIERGLYEIEHGGELAEQDDLPSLRNHLVDELEQALQLRRTWRLAPLPR